MRSIEHACRITRVERTEHLIASHIQPWRDSSNDQRLDGENDLLLTPTMDHLFDQGISGGTWSSIARTCCAWRAGSRRVSAVDENSAHAGMWSLQCVRRDGAWWCRIAKPPRLLQTRSVSRELAFRARIDTVDALGLTVRTADRCYLDFSA